MDLLILIYFYNKEIQSALHKTQKGIKTYKEKMHQETQDIM